MLGQFLLAGLISPAFAVEYVLETGPLVERADADAVERVVDEAGFDSRVVRRFKLGQSWQFVVVAEGFASEPEARAAAVRLATDLGRPVSVFRVGPAGAEAVPATAEAEPAPATGVPELLERARTAHGGEGGGAGALGRQGAVHFVFLRRFVLAGKQAEVRHDYWREGGARRLRVETRGGGQDSLAVAAAGSAWLQVGAMVHNVDVGVTIGTVDAFAPESVLSLALDIPTLLDAPEVERFRALEGAESGVRVGQGGDETEPGLSFVDLDPASGRLVRARYVTDAGPVTFHMEGWREVAPGVVVPATVRIVRADGVEERVDVELLDVAPHAPAGAFDRPT